MQATPFMVVETRKWKLVQQSRGGECQVTFKDAPDHPQHFLTVTEGLRHAREMARM